MSGTLLFMIVDEVPDRAQKLKSLIEFLDVPQVQIASPDSWRARLGDRRLAAIFVSNDLGEAVVHEVIRDVGEHDPNVPIVMVDNRQDANPDHS